MPRTKVRKIQANSELMTILAMIQSYNTSSEITAFLDINILFIFENVYVLYYILHYHLLGLFWNLVQLHHLRFAL